MTDTLIDARGVPITPGDTAIYGFTVGRSVAMAEAVVLGELVGPDLPPGVTAAIVLEEKVSLTPSGRVRLRVVRRSYGGGEKPVVDVAPDRLVVLKRESVIVGDVVCSGFPYLPPLPTQDEEARAKIERAIESYKRGLRATEVPPFWAGEDGDLLGYHVWCAERLADCHEELEKLDE
ncbi:hypothetical protein BJP40_06530 [Streptomyces sp. CC53]|uniref:hypothetical protein n=1 Tax=Streptomyces sp. CC53 TaxID=1906740 RepID=UPI0008DDF884|nr:hypothetical protein [Streptomyces sp. CC53]OII61178.1 hypothetical protein BJP40_06530 [Streptomyces sp. CC53]